jgi:hypothetical protein
MLSVFLSGAFMMGLAVAGLVFFRSWRDTKDPLFLRFSAAFWLMAVERIPLALLHKMKEPGSFVYVLRLVAYLLILDAIRGKRSGAPAASRKSGLHVVKSGLLLIFFIPGAYAVEKRPWRYEIVMGPGARELRIEATFPGVTSLVLEPRAEAAPFIHDVEMLSGKKWTAIPPKNGQ